MGVSISALALAILLQGPGDGWAFVHDTGKVKTLYWELFDTTEVWLRLIPEGAAGEAPLQNLIFQAYFPGKQVKGRPARVVVRALALPLTLIRTPMLRFDVDGKSLGLTSDGARFRYLYPVCGVEGGCSANGVEAELEPALLASMIEARSLTGEGLGFTFRLTAKDQRLLAEFADAVRLGPEPR
jgi:hypothetical protein